VDGAPERAGRPLVTLDGDPIDPAGQGFCCTSEMRLADPDGYVLMVAQNE
jgi:hypothetical protein